MAVEDTALGDNDVLALLQFGFDSALDDEAVAGSDLTRKGNSLSNDQGSAVDLVTWRGSCSLSRLSDPDA